MVRSEWTTITPAMAEKWLEGKAPNRVVREDLAIEYALAMERNDWQKTHQGIAFDDENRLVDGQHRLLAVTISKTPVKMMVTRGLTKDEVLAVDVGRSRTAADSLSIFKGHHVDMRSVATVRNLIKYSAYYAAIAQKTPGSTWRISYPMIDEFMQKHAEALMTGTEPRRRCRLQGVTSTLLSAILTRAHYHLTRSRMSELIDVLVTGRYENAGEDSGAILLRNHLISDPRQREGLVGYFRIERAIKAFAEKEALGRIFPATKELYPLPEEQDTVKGVAVKPAATIARLAEARAAKHVKAAATRKKTMQAKKFAKDTL